MNEDFNAIERSRWGGPSPWAGKDSRTDAQKLDDETRTALISALHSAIVALNRNGFVTRSAALYDLAEAITRHLGLEWNPYGQTTHPRPDGLGMDVTRRDEDIRP